MVEGKQERVIQLGLPRSTDVFHGAPSLLPWFMSLEFPLDMQLDPTPTFSDSYV